MAGDINETVTLLERMTGVDLRQLVSRVSAGAPASPAPSNGASPVPPTVVDGTVTG